MAVLREKYPTIQIHCQQCLSARKTTLFSCPPQDMYCGSKDIKSRQLSPRAIPEYIVNNRLFPETNLEGDISGSTIVRFIVGQDGKLSDVTAISETPERPAQLGFSEAGITTMIAMRFIPGKIDGKPVRVGTRQTIKFTSK